MKNKGWEGIDWHCIRCGSLLKSTEPDVEEEIDYDTIDWDKHDNEPESEDFLCTNKDCFHHKGPLTLFNSLGGYTSQAGESYAIGWVR